MAIRESGEDYLETILLLSRRKDGVHSVDVANELGYSRPSITRAMGILKDAGLVVIQKGHIVLTERGEARAQEIYERHRTIAEFLRLIGVEEEIAAKDACRMEHDVSRETFDRIKEFVARRSDGGE